MLAEPRPRSEAQREAARANGARSRGPTSAEGKARSSMNAFRHGLCSPAILAPGEDPEEFVALLAALRAEHRPADATADLLVERLAVALWKLDRCDRLEAQLAACRPRPPAGRIFIDGTPPLLTRTSELATLSAHAARLERAVHRLLAALAARPRAAAPSRRPTDSAGRAPAPTASAFAPRPSPQVVQNRENEPEPAPAEALAPASAPPAARHAEEREALRWPPRTAALSPSPDAVESRGNEPEPASPSATAPSPAQPEPSPGIGKAAADPEALVLSAARGDPLLATAIAEQLAGEGELVRLQRFLHAEGREVARALFADRPRASAA